MENRHLPLPAWGRSTTIWAEQLVLEKPYKDEVWLVTGSPHGASSSHSPRLPALHQIPQQMHQDPPVLLGKSHLPTLKTPHPVQSGSSETGSWKSLNSSRMPGTSGADVLGSALLSSSPAPPAPFFPSHSCAQECVCAPAVEQASESTEYLRFTPDFL